MQLYSVILQGALKSTRFVVFLQEFICEPFVQNQSKVPVFTFEV